MSGGVYRLNRSRGSVGRLYERVGVAEAPGVFVISSDIVMATA